MKTHPSVFGHAGAGLLAGLLVSCGGGGYGGGGSSPPPATLNMSIAPMTIMVGQSATITWSSNAGTSCTASGAWTGTKAANGSEMVSPAAAGSFTYTLRCRGGGYGESQASSVLLTVTARIAFTQTLLVSRFAGSAALTTDPKLVNPRGIAFGPTGIVAIATSDFVVAASGKSGSSEFVYAGKGGMIGGWSPAIDPADAVTKYVDTGGAVYTGLAVAINRSHDFLYATDFRNNKIDVFDASFTRQTPSAVRFAFSDLKLPAGFAPFGIQAIKSGAAGSMQIYVTYAKQMPPDNYDSAIGAGLGLVNVFDTNGKLLRRLIPAGGALNAPWGIALAPADFGALSQALLIGNFGDGRINAFDPMSGKFICTVSDADGRPIATRGLWGIAFGNDSNNQPHNTLFFAASTDEADGTYGRVDLGATPPMLEVMAPRQ